MCARAFRTYFPTSLVSAVEVVKVEAVVVVTEAEEKAAVEEMVVSEAEVEAEVEATDAEMVRLRCLRNSTAAPL